MNVNGIGGADPAGPVAGRAARPPAPPLRTNEAVPAPAFPPGGAARREPEDAVRRGGPPQDEAAGPQPTGTRLRVDPETKRIVAQIVNQQGEVIRQLPPEDLLELSVRFRRLEGLLFDRES